MAYGSDEENETLRTISVLHEHTSLHISSQQTAVHEYISQQHSGQQSALHENALRQYIM